MKGAAKVDIAGTQHGFNENKKRLLQLKEEPPVAWGQLI